MRISTRCELTVKTCALGSPALVPEGWYEPGGALGATLAPTDDPLSDIRRASNMMTALGVEVARIETSLEGYYRLRRSASAHRWFDIVTDRALIVNGHFGTLYDIPVYVSADAAPGYDMRSAHTYETVRSVFIPLDVEEP